MKKAFCGILLLAGMTWAQPPAPRHGPGPGMAGPRHIDGLAKQLSLTDAQKERATTIFADAHKATQALHTSMKQAHDALNLAVQKNDTVGIDRAALQAGTLMAQEMSIQSKADAAFRQTLGAEQQTKLDQMHTRGGPPPDGAPRPQHPRRPPPPPAE